MVRGPGIFSNAPPPPPGERAGNPVPLHKSGATESRRTPEMRQPEGREVVIVEAVRTPIGRGHREKGYYKDTHPNTLLAKCYTEVIERSGVDASEVEDGIAGCVQQFRSE